MTGTPFSRTLIRRVSLNVAGSYTLDQSVQLGDSQFWSIAPDQLPGWIVSRKWNMATFVEAVNGYQGGEGIYFYSTQAIQNWPWLYGASTDQPQYLTQPYLQPTANLEEKSVMGLPTNFRGEYSSAYFRQPRLYFSPIDNRLHLLYGQGGVWNLGQGLVLRLQNLEGAAFVDSWIRERLSTDQLKSATLQAVPGYTEEALYALGGYLIYAGGGNVEFGPLVESSSRFVISPPGDKSSWLAFRERIAQYSGQERSPMDLESWLLALHGPTFALSGAQLEDMRAMPGGFRFLLDLQPGFQGRGEDLLDAASLSPGRYVVTYQGRFRVEKLTPPSLTASIVGAGSLLMEKNPVRVLLSNHGLQDAEQATVELLARSPGGGGKIVAAQTVDLLAGNTLAITLSWTPATTGIWMLTPLIRESDGSVVFGDAVSAVVFAPKNSGLNALLLTTASRGRLPVILAVLLILAGFGALQLWRNWGRMLGTGKRR